MLSSSRGGKLRKLCECSFSCSSLCGQKWATGPLHFEQQEAISVHCAWRLFRRIRDADRQQQAEFVTTATTSGRSAGRSVGIAPVRVSTRALIEATMSKNQLRREIQELAEILAESVVKAINSRSLAELAAITDAREDAPKVRRASAPAPKRVTKKPVPASTKPTKPTRPKPVKESASPEETRAEVIRVLQTSKEWMKANAIFAATKKKPTPDLLGRVLRQLMEEGHIVKQGATRNTAYQITASGLAL